jgi:site-specific DNA-cytosine methylase
MCDVTPQILVDNNTTIAVDDNEITLFSVCAGIGSGQMAIERAGLPVKRIGICETDSDCVELFQEAFPGIPVYGDMRFVITALEQGDLYLRPTILELTVTCQARSVARVLADWSDTVHPSARLWDLQ